MVSTALKYLLDYFESRKQLDDVLIKDSGDPLMDKTVRDVLELLLQKMVGI